MYAKVFGDTRVVPHERYSVLIVLEEVAGINAEGAKEKALDVISKVFSPDGISNIVDSQVDACKKWLKNNVSKERPITKESYTEEQWNRVLKFLEKDIEWYRNQ